MGTPLRFSLLICISLFNWLDVSNSQAVLRSKYGEFCNETVKCDKGDWLLCQSSSCACLLDDMTFDQMKGKCVSKPGERCKFQVSEIATEKVGLAFYENVDCVTNAHCANGFTCSCVPGYYESVDGTCVEQKGLNATCLSSAECQDANLLHCIEGQCQCSGDRDHVWGKPTNHSESLRCVGRAGRQLNGGTECIEGTQLANGICECVMKQEFYAGPNGKCVKKKLIDDLCSSDEECQFKDNFFTCVNGVCGCDPRSTLSGVVWKNKLVQPEIEIQVWNPRYSRGRNLGENSYRRYDNDVIVKGILSGGNSEKSDLLYIKQTIAEQITQCVGKANQNCNEDSNCVENANCALTKLCTCITGYSVTSTGACGIGHGGPCSSSRPCSDLFLCTNSICKCSHASHQIYDASMEMCVGLVSSYCAQTADCRTNMVCTTAQESGRKQCACATGFVENGKGSCEKEWNSTCNYSNAPPCDSVAELECRNGLCSCPDGLTKYDKSLRKCLGLVGTRCFVNEPSSCISGAKCVQMNLKFAGRCLCQPGFKVKDDMGCDIITSPSTSDITLATGNGTRTESSVEEVDTVS